MSESALWRPPDEARLVLVMDAPFGDGGHELISSDGHSTTAIGQIPRPGPSRVPRRMAGHHRRRRVTADPARGWAGSLRLFR